ncbi:MAG: rare lipoprotein, partial [Bacteroidota bacterium]|nr:rare lipoprotein [Bacteroidota bacterium]
EDRNVKRNNDNFTVEDFNKSNDYYFESSGKASYYGKRFHNRKTASGEKYDMNQFTAAHKSLPFGTILRITSLESNKVVLVRINDRGPFRHKRVIDLSYKAAKALEGLGTPEVKIEGMLPGTGIINLDDDESMYFGYSYDMPLVCLPVTALSLVDSTSDFDKAIKRYEELRPNYSVKPLFLFIEKENMISMKNNNQMYYLATAKYPFAKDVEKEFAQLY